MYQIITYYYEDEEKIAELYSNSKVLWGEHLCYTRNVIISLLNGTKDVEAVTDRLMKNQEQIAELLFPYYDKNDVEAYTGVLKEHLTIAVKIIEASKAKEDTTDLIKEWYGNGEKMLAWLENENSYYWSRVVTKPLWNDHLKYTMDEVETRLKEDWIGDIAAFDNNRQCMHKWADLYATGIVYNHMEHFSKKMPHALDAKKK